MDLVSGGALEAAAWKVKSLDDFEARLERAARGVGELAEAHETAALVIYEAVLMKSGHPVEEVRRLDCIGGVRAKRNRLFPQRACSQHRGRAVKPPPLLHR